MNTDSFISMLKLTDCALHRLRPKSLAHACRTTPRLDAQAKFCRNFFGKLSELLTVERSVLVGLSVSRSDIELTPAGRATT